MDMKRQRHNINDKKYDESELGNLKRLEEKSIRK